MWDCLPHMCYVCQPEDFFICEKRKGRDSKELRGRTRTREGNFLDYLKELTEQKIRNNCKNRAGALVITWTVYMLAIIPASACKYAHPRAHMPTNSKFVGSYIYNVATTRRTSSSSSSSSVRMSKFWVLHTAIAEAFRLGKKHEK